MYLNFIRVCQLYVTFSTFQREKLNFLPDYLCRTGLITSYFSDTDYQYKI